MRSPLSRRHRTAAAVLVGVGTLTACGSGSSSDGSAPPTAPAPSTAPPETTAALPAPKPSADPRSPEALATLFSFEAPPQDDPVVEEALDGYADFVRQFVIAQGLGDPDYPPLLARIDPSDPALRDRVLRDLSLSEAMGEYLLGNLVDRVTDVAGDASSVLIDTCTEYSGRKVYKSDPDRLLGSLDVGLEVVRARAVMTRSGDRWVLSQVPPQRAPCRLIGAVTTVAADRGSHARTQRRPTKPGVARGAARLHVPTTGRPGGTGRHRRLRRICTSVRHR